MKTSICSPAVKSNRILQAGLTFLSAVTVWSAFTAGAQILWQGGTADYDHPENWSGGAVPGALDNAVNANGSNNVVLINPDDPDWTLNDLSAGGAVSASGAIMQNGRNVNLSGWLHIGDGVNSFGSYTLNSGTLNVTNPGAQLFLGEGLGSTSLLNINGGTVNVAGTLHVADGNWNGAAARTGTVNQTAGTVNATGFVQIGVTPGGTGIYNLSGGVINMLAPVEKKFIVAAGGNGTLNLSGGVINSSFCEFWIGNGAGSAGTVNLSGNAALNVNNWLAVGRNGTGILNVSNNAVITRTGPGNLTIGIGISGDGVGVVNQYGGSITNTSSQTWIGESGNGQGNGTWNMEGGTAILGQVLICRTTAAPAADGTLNLEGGRFQTTGITGNNSATGSLFFNGGTLVAGADNADFITGVFNAKLRLGGAVIDSQNYNITIPQALTDSGGGTLTKLGTGTLTLAGANTYIGDTAVKAGTLIISTAAGNDINYTVADNAGFGVTVLVQNGRASANNLTLGSSAGATLIFNLGNFGNPATAPLVVKGTVAINGKITVNVAGTGLQTGQFPLIKLSGSWSGLPVLGSLPSGVTAHLVENTAAGSLDLDITAVN